MIFYFSATGNSKHVAERIAQEGEQLLALTEVTEKEQFVFDVTDQRVGVISPTYNWTLPSIVSDFLQKLILRYAQRPYLFYVGTYGTTTGAAAAMADDLLGEHGLSFDAMFDVRMPDTWTPTFDLSDEAHVKEINDKAEKEIDELKTQLEANVTGKHMGLTMPRFAGRIGLHLYNTKTRNTANLSVTDACIGCGMCARKCPAHAIELREKKPVWVKQQCIMCLGCLHRCPKFAIQCGKNTAKHGQYRNPYTKI